MAIAALNAESLMITDQLAEYEFERTVIDQQRESLAAKQAQVYENFTIENQKITIDSKDADDDGSTVTFDDKAWTLLNTEYQIETAALDRQDKQLEMERTRIDNKIEALEAYKESVDKRLQNNVEKDMKGMN